MSTRHVARVSGLPAPAAPYSLAVIAGCTCHVSGQVALGADGRLDAGDVQHESRVALGNVEKVLLAAGFALADVVMVTVLLADIEDFTVMNAEYERWWPPDGRPARIAYQAGALPLGARVEIQCVAQKPGEQQPAQQAGDSDMLV